MPAIAEVCRTIKFTEYSQLVRTLALQLKPDRVYYVGGFGVLSKWLPVSEYEVSLNSAHGLKY